MSQFQTITQAERRAVEGEAEAEARKITANLVPAVSAELHVHRDGQDRRQRLVVFPETFEYAAYVYTCTCRLVLNCLFH